MPGAQGVTWQGVEASARSKGQNVEGLGGHVKDVSLGPRTSEQPRSVRTRDLILWGVERAGAGELEGWRFTRLFEQPNGEVAVQMNVDRFNTYFEDCDIFSLLAGLPRCPHCGALRFSQVTRRHS